MAAKKSAAKPAKGAAPDEPRNAQNHEMVTMTTVQNALVIEKFSCVGEVEVGKLIGELHDKAMVVRDGDLGQLETMLYSQAQSLQAIFTNMARRSAINAGEYLNASETYMKLALKAQAQCRATIETLAQIKNPQPYIKQANIAQGGHQQVNNMYASASAHSSKPSGAGNIQPEPNKLLEADHGQRMDIGAQGAAGRANQTVEAVV